MAPENAVYCTLLLSDSFLPGAMVLAHSLRDAGTAARLAVLYTPGTLQPETIAELESTYNDLIPVPPIANTTTPASLFLINRPDLITTFTKVELWRQTQFQRIVYLDADVLALRAPDELLSLSLPSTGTGEKRIAAAPDTGWPDCFNSGVMVLTPNMADYHALRDRAERGVTYDGADQGLLNMYFGEEGWERLRFGYNCTASRIPGTPAGAGVSVGSGAGVGAGSQYQYLPAYRQFAGSVSLAHFVGAVKPWSATRAQRREERGEVYDELVGRWWEVYHRCYRPNRTVSGVGGHGRGQEHVFETSTEGNPHPSYPGESDAHGHDLGLHVDNHESTLPEEHTRTGPTPSSVSLEHLEPAEEHDGHSPTFNPPIAEWDASRYVNPPTAIHPSTPVLKSKREPPPANTKPEGIALQQQTYRMSTDTRLFQPEPYPAIPQTVNINTSVLATPEPGKIAPIFPWEGWAPKPTRVFASSTAGSSAPTFTTSTSVEGPGQSPDKDTPPAIDPETKIEQQPSPPSWQTHTHSNAWDEVPGIQQYVQSVEDARARPAREAQRRTDATTTTATNSNTHEDVWSESRLLSSDGGGDGDEGTSHTSLSSAGGLRQKTGMDALDDWISVTADGFWDLVRVAYLYWAFVNVGRDSGCQPTS